MNERKRLMSMLLVIAMTMVMIFSLGIVSIWAAEPITIKVNNVVIGTDAEPYIKSNRTMVPIATIMKYCDAEVEWNEADKTVKIIYENDKIEMEIGSKLALINDNSVKMEVAPEIKVVDKDGGGRAMVPLRVIAEAFHFDVGWEPENRTVKMFSPDYDPDLDPSIIKVFINGEKLIMDAEPYIKNNRTMVPVSAVVSGMGGEVEWDPDTKTAELMLNDTSITLKIGLNEAVLNNKIVLLDSSPDIKVVDDKGGGRMMLPLRFVAESFGFKVEWDSKTSQVIITNGVPQEDVEKKLSFSIDNKYTFRNESYTAVIIRSTANLLKDKLRITSLSDPYRYYVDFSGYTLQEGCLEELTNDNFSAGVTGVRSSYQESGGAYRVVVDTDRKNKPEEVYSMDGMSMMLLFKQEKSSSDTPERYEVKNYHTFSDGKYVVVLDPGHGESTAGKRSCDGSLREWEFNRDLAYKIKAVLESKGVQCIVTVAKNDKTDPSLATRVAIANKDCLADIFVSIHANAYGNGTDWNSVTGWECYYYKDGVKDSLSKQLSQDIKTATFDEVPDFVDRGIKTENYYVVKNTLMPSVLIEHGFYTNKNEVERLKDPAFRQKLVDADVNGIMAFLESHK